MKRVYQILFNRPLQYEDRVIYGVRVACDEGKAKRLMDYAVELVGHWCFTQKHDLDIHLTILFFWTNLTH